MGRLATLLQWHYQDGITNAERQRDQIHDLYQNNRNPFVDRPELVWAVFGGGNNNSRLYVGSLNPPSGASAANVNLRVIKGASTWGSSNVTLNKVGVHPTTLDITASGSATTTAAGPEQTIDYNSVTRLIGDAQRLDRRPVGTITGTVTIDNTDITSGGTGMGRMATTRSR